MKSVLISIQPKWIEKIVNGKKTIEVRKSRPKIETPFKCYIYCTNTPKYHHLYDLTRYNKWERLLSVTEHNKHSLVPKGYLNGKVIGEFICDRVDELPCGVNQPFWLKEKTCIDDEHYKNYLGNKNGYGWNISELKIYDKPKELSEFRPICKFEGKDAICALFCLNWKYDGGLFFECTRKVTRPPQSWCYVEELCKEQN